MVVDSLIEVSAWASACAVKLIRLYIEQRDQVDPEEMAEIDYNSNSEPELEYKEAS